MSRRKLAGIVTRESEVAGKPSHSVELRCGEVWVFQKMLAAGPRGVTCRDFNGADLRHYIRNLKHKGIGIDHEWETDAFSQHKRWRLRGSHTFKEIPYKPKRKKPIPTATGQAQNPNANSENAKGLDNE